MKVSIRFSLVSANATDCPIRMRVSYDCMRLDLRTGFVCPPDKWDAQTQRMIPGTRNRYHESASLINTRLSEQEACVLRLIQHYEIDNLVPETATLKADFEAAQGRTKRTDTTSLNKVVDDFCRTRSSDWTNKTSAAYTSLARLLETQKFARKDINAISLKDLNSMVTYMFDEGYENQTVKQRVTQLKTVFRWAKQQGTYIGSLPDAFNPKLIGIGKKDVHYLEWKEFLLLFNLDLHQCQETLVRDMFCLCCTTGIRISDCAKLRFAEVHLSADTPCIALVAKKTKKQTIIELNKYSRAILSRYALASELRTEVFPAIDRHAYSCILKKICKDAGLDRQVRVLSFVRNRMTEQFVPIHERITSHWGRHTFIVHALSIGIPPITIMSWTGHSSYDSMKPYIAIADKYKKESMSKFDQY